MKLNLTDVQIRNTPIASGGGVFFCPDPTCHHPHIILVDDDHHPMAHFIIGPEFYAELQAAMAQRTGVEIAYPERRFMLYTEVEELYLEAVEKNQITGKLNRLQFPAEMALALDKIGKIKLASK